MSKLKKMLKSENGHFVGDVGFRAFTEIFNAVFGIITFSILSRILSKSDYAVVNQTIAVSSLIAPIVLLKINSAFCIFFAGDTDQARLKSRFFSSLLMDLPMCIIIFGCLFGGSVFFSNLMFGSRDYSFIMGWMAIYFIILSLSTLMQDFYRAVKRIKTSSVLLITKTFVTSALFIFLVLSRHSVTVDAAIKAYCAAEGLVLILGFISILHYFREIPLKIEFAPLKEYLKYSLPLMPYVVMSWINSFIDRFILNHLQGLEISGVYSFNYSLVSRVFVISSILSYTILPYISMYWNQNNKAQVESYLQKASRLGMFLGFPIIFGLYQTSPTIVQLLSGGNFSVNRPLLLILSFAFLFQMLYNMYSYLIDLSRKTVMYNVVFLISSIINVVFNFMLIPVIGIYGAAVSTLLTYIIQFIITAIIGTRSTGITIRMDFKYILKTFLITMIMLIVLMAVYRNNGLLNFTVSVFAGIIVYFGVSYGAAKAGKTKMV